MSTPRIRGFDNPDQIREYMDDLDDGSVSESPQDRAIRREIARLRAQIEDLRIRVGEMHAFDTDQPYSAGSKRQPLSTIVLGIVAGQVLRRLGLGWAGAIVTPYLVSRMSRTIWRPA